MPPKDQPGFNRSDQSVVEVRMGKRVDEPPIMREGVSEGEKEAIKSSCGSMSIRTCALQPNLA